MDTGTRRSRRLRLRFLTLASCIALLSVSPGTAQALCMAPMYRNPFYFQAHQALRDGRHLEAIDLYRKAARTPEQARRWIASVWYRLGLQSRSAERPLEAADHFRAALREAPTHQGAAIQLVQSLADGGRPRQALRELHSLSPGLRDVRSLLHLEARLLATTRDLPGLREVVRRLEERGWLTPAERAALARLGADGPRLTGPGVLGDP